MRSATCRRHEPPPIPTWRLSLSPIDWGLIATVAVGFYARYTTIVTRRNCVFEVLQAEAVKQAAARRESLTQARTSAL